MITNPSLLRQRGAAVIVALLVVALATMAATGFIFRSQMEWRKLENASNLDQARWIMRAAEQWGSYILMDDARNSTVDHLGEIWAKELPPIESEGYELSGRIVEQDSLFNLNNLVSGGRVDERQFKAFQRLLAVLRLPPDLAWNIADWLDADQTPLRENSPESDYYLSLEQPYMAADRPLAHVDELIRVKGVNKAVLDQLRPYVSVLPTRTAVNVNIATPEVLVAMVEGLTLEQAHAVVTQRNRAWFRDVGEFVRTLPQGLTANADLLSVNSQYFVVRAHTRHGRISVGSQALLYRSGPGLPTILWRASL